MQSVAYVVWPCLELGQFAAAIRAFGPIVSEVRIEVTVHKFYMHTFTASLEQDLARCSTLRKLVVDAHSTSPRAVVSRLACRNLEELHFRTPKFTSSFVFPANLCTLVGLSLANARLESGTETHCRQDWQGLSCAMTRLSAQTKSPPNSSTHFVTGPACSLCAGRVRSCAVSRPAV